MEGIIIPSVFLFKFVITMEASGATSESVILTRRPLDTLKYKIYLLLPIFLLHEQNRDGLTNEQNRG